MLLVKEPFPDRDSCTARQGNIPTQRARFMTESKMSTLTFPTKHDTRIQRALHDRGGIVRRHSKVEYLGTSRFQAQKQQ